MKDVKRNRFEGHDHLGEPRDSLGADYSCYSEANVFNLCE